MSGAATLTICPSAAATDSHPAPKIRPNCRAGSSDGAVKLLEPSSGKVEWQFNVTAGASHVDVLAANPTNSRHAAVALSDPSKRGDSAVVAHFDVRSSKHSARLLATLVLLTMLVQGRARSCSVTPHPPTHIDQSKHKTTLTHAGGKADVQDSIGNPALAMAWHPGGTRLGVARRNGKLSIYDIRKLGSKARAVCEETLAWELNKFLFVGDGDRLVASYGHQQRGGFRVLKVRRPCALRLHSFCDARALRAACAHTAIHMCCCRSARQTVPCSRAAPSTSAPLLRAQAADLSPVTAAECHLMPCVGLALSQDGALLATGGNDAIVTVWDTSRNVIVNSIYQIDYPCNNVSISHDGSWLAYTGATEKGRAVSVEVAERFADPGESPQIHRYALSLNLPARACASADQQSARACTRRRRGGFSACSHRCRECTGGSRCT